MGDRHSHLFDLLQQFFRKMKTGGRSGCGTLTFGIDRLIPILILQLVRDVGRQRHLPQFIQDLLKNPFIGELDQPVSLFHDVDHRPLQSAVSK